MSNKKLALLFCIFLSIGLSFLMPWYVAGLLGFTLFSILIVFAVFTPSYGFFIKSFYTLPDKNAILLTYDDGPDPEITPKVLQILKSHQAKAVFFCIGNKIQKYPELASQILENGHIIANHTWLHQLTWGFMSTQQAKSEIAQTEAVIKNSKQWFRPPFGVTNPNIAQALTECQMKMFTWSFRTYDTKFSYEDICKKVNQKLNGGDIILMHDTVSFSPELTEYILKFAKNKQFTFQNPHLLDI